MRVQLLLPCAKGYRVLRAPTKCRGQARPDCCALAGALGLWPRHTGGATSPRRHLMLTQTQRVMVAVENDAARNFVTDNLQADGYRPSPRAVLATRAAGFRTSSTW